MKISYLSILLAFYLTTSCGGGQTKTEAENTDTLKTEEVITDQETDGKEYPAEQFADVKLIRYYVDEFDKLTPKQKELTYYLYEAALAGRDMIWDQNYKHNLTIRRLLENIVMNYEGDKSTPEWEQFMVYTKRVWFSNGIHHHYGMEKFVPEFSYDYLKSLVANTTKGEWPVKSGQNIESLLKDLEPIIFDPTVDAKRVTLDPKKDIIKTSANNLYEGVTQKEVEAYYAPLEAKAGDKAISFGLNSKMVKENGKVTEMVYKAGGMYGAAIDKIVFWLKKAVTVAENEEQAEALRLLVKYYETGDLKTWDDYNIAWVKDVNSVVDVINGFIEVYGDAKGYRGTFESVVSIKDFDASERMAKVSEYAQWFEDNSSILPEHKKEKVVGVSYKVISVVVESGDASPSTPIGINLPNANWIRAEHGSKSVSLGNIIHAYDKSAGQGLLEEFANDQEEIDRAIKYGDLGGKMHTALHEVIGHASGKIEKGVGTPKETLQSYSSTLEEGRADLVALYYILDPKLVEIGLMPSIEVGKTEYDSYIRNGLVTQLRRLKPGDVIEEAHMRNRQFVAAWVYEKGKAENVIEKLTRDGKTYYNINDYEKLRVLFGDLLREVQRIKSKGDYEAGMALVENYGVQVDANLHAEVLQRSEKLNIPPYGGFINPKLIAVADASGVITDVKVEYPASFTEQMLEYAKNHSFLPNYN